MVTVVFVSSHNCAYCKPIKPVIEELKATYEDCEDVVFTSIEIGPNGENLDFAREWNVQGVPLIILIRRLPNQPAMEEARLMGADDVTKDKIIYCIESFRTNEQGNLQSDVLPE